jgi:hypothetical protein
MGINHIMDKEEESWYLRFHLYGFMVEKPLRKGSDVKSMEEVL